MIKLIALDIDGTITDGKLMVDAQGNEFKTMNFKDVDAIFELHHRGYKLAAITGDDTPIVSYFKNRFPWDYFFCGNKTKTDALKLIEDESGINRNDICYVGDGKYDAGPLKYAGLGMCPNNAVDRAKHAADIILQNDGGQGCLWEIIDILENYNDEENGADYFFKRLEEHSCILKSLGSNRELIDTIMSVADDLIKVFQSSNKLFIAGNGGSAADAQHIATEFVSRFYKERRGLNAEALSVNTSSITAIGNDYSFENIFTRQLEAKAVKGDMFIGISTSGASSNVLSALRYAKKEGLITVLLMGEGKEKFDNSMADYIIKVPSRITPRIQEAHIFIGHVIAEYVEYKMFMGEKELL